MESCTENTENVENVENTRARGKIKFFDATRGFGFIVREDGKKDCFVHHSDVLKISGDEKVHLDENDAVEFTVVDDAKGPRAADVKRV